MSSSRNRTLADAARKLGDEAARYGRNAYLFGLGAAASAEEEVRGIFERMVAKGEDFEKSDRNLVARAADRARSLGRIVEQGFRTGVSATLTHAGVPSRDEIRTLIERVEELTEKIEALGARR